MSDAVSGHLLEIMVAIMVVVVLIVIVNRNTAEASGETDTFIRSFEPGILKGSVGEKPLFTCTKDGGAYSYTLDMGGVSLISEEEEINFRALAEFTGPKTGHSLIALSKSSSTWKDNDVSFVYDAHNAKTGLYATQKFDPSKIGTPKIFARVTLWRESECVKSNFPVDDGTHAVKTKKGDAATSVDVLNACAASYLSAFDIPATILNNYVCNEQLCKGYDYATCTNQALSLGMCYYNTGFVDKQCKGCRETDTCSSLNKDQCGSCAVAGSSCVWADDRCIDPTKAKAIEVKADPGKNPIEIDVFRFSNDGAAGKCIVHASNAESPSFTNPFGFDAKATWIVEPGGKITKTGSLCSGLLSKCGAAKDYVTYTGNLKASINPDDNKEALGGAQYGNTVSDKCTSGCDLLSIANGKHTWQPRTELLCADGGFWLTCDEGRVAKAEGVPYVCASGSWSNAEAGSSDG